MLIQLILLGLCFIVFLVSFVKMSVLNFQLDEKFKGIVWGFISIFIFFLLCGDVVVIVEFIHKC